MPYQQSLGLQKMCTLYAPSLTPLTTRPVCVMLAIKSYLATSNEMQCMYDCVCGDDIDEKRGGGLLVIAMAVVVVVVIMALMTMTASVMV